MWLAGGVGATLVAAGWLALLAAKPGALARWPVYGTVAGIALAMCVGLLALRLLWAATLFTALAWTCYIALVDAAVYRRRGFSLLHQPGAAVALALFSIPGWLIFEAYNFRLRNWIYTGVPAHYWMFVLGASWAFATVFPGILETADLIETAATAGWRCRPWRPDKGTHVLLVAVGVASLVAPLLLPPRFGAYWFAPVWAGFVLLLDPIHQRLGFPSLLGDLARGRPGRFVALLLAGGVCGLLWESWNYWALARWRYVFPIFQRGRVFAMPLPGFIGFPPFAVECFTLAVFFSYVLLPPRMRWLGLER